MDLLRLLAASVTARRGPGGEQAAPLRCEPRGLTDVKGRGLMETFDTVVDRPALLKSRGPSRRRESDASHGDTPVLAMGELDLDSLSPETRQLWAGDGAGSTGGGGRARFNDPAMEEEFARAVAGSRQQALGLGLLLHWILVAVQWLQVCHPEHDYGFQTGGQDGLKAAQGRVELILGVHFGASTALGLGLAWRLRAATAGSALAPDAGVVDSVERGLCALKAIHVAACAAAFICFPGQVPRRSSMLCSVNAVDRDDAVWCGSFCIFVRESPYEMLAVHAQWQSHASHHR